MGYIIDPKETGQQLRQRLNSSGWTPREIANLMGMETTSSPRRWLCGEAYPSGGLQVRLYYSMVELGVDFPGLERLKREAPLGYFLGRLFAFQVIDLDRVLAICQLKKEQDAYAVMRGRPVAHPSKDLETLQAEYDEVLDAALRQFRGEFAELAQRYAEMQATDEAEVTDGGDAEPVIEMVPVVPSDETTLLPMLTREPFLVETAQRLGGLLPALRYLASDSCTPAERALFRALLGDEGVFEAATLLRRLCGERARETLQEG